MRHPVFVGVPGRPAYQRTASKTSEHATLALQLRPMASACMDPPSARCDEAGNDGIDELGIRAPVCRTLINLLNAGGERALARGRRQLRHHRNHGNPREWSCFTSASAPAPTKARAARSVSRRSSAARTSGAPTTRTFGVFQKRGAHQRRLSAPSSITRTPIGCMRVTIGERRRRAYRENFRICQNYLFGRFFSSSIAWFARRIASSPI